MSVTFRWARNPVVRGQYDLVITCASRLAGQFEVRLFPPDTEALMRFLTTVPSPETEEAPAPREASR